MESALRGHTETTDITSIVGYLGLYEYHFEEWCSISYWPLCPSLIIRLHAGENKLGHPLSTALGTAPTHHPLSTDGGIYCNALGRCIVS